MHVVVVLFSLLLAISPCGETQKLRGPSRPKPKVVLVHTGRCHTRCGSYRLRKNSNRRYRICRPPQTIIIIQNQISPPKPKVELKPAPRPTHKTIYVGQNPPRAIPRAKSRMQILRESKAKIAARREKSGV